MKRQIERNYFPRVILNLEPATETREEFNPRRGRDSRNPDPYTLGTRLFIMD